MAYRKTLSLFLLGIVIQIQALEEEPWFYPPWHFQAKGLVDVSFFNNVHNGYNPIGYHSTNIQAALGLLVPFSQKGDVEVEIELEQTTKLNFGFESGAFQMRRSILNDIIGDFVSLDVGGNIRFVPKQRLCDVAVPYHNLWNFELVGALGKELSRDDDWWFRTYILTAIGQANRGYPWIKADFNVKGKAFKGYLIEGFLKSYFGLGNYTLINVRQFDGYAMYRHQSVDLGVAFSLLFKTRGTLTLSYVHRVYAKTFPDDYNEFRLNYDLPFSF